ncbi:MAG: ATP-binding cassette domain-containing protein [Variovorax sp.]|nr:MAG: ATP-binding cassette domain-containing protein [Variovorax sp.]
MITLKNVILRRSAKLLLDGASVTLNPGEKVGLVGRNGAGKSSLFALFNGGLHEDGGDFSIPKQWRMAQVAQDMPETEESASDFVVGGDTRLVELRERLAAIEAAYAENPDDGDIGMEMAHVYTDLADAGEHDALSRAQALVLGLGFKSSELDAPVNSFSGGWRMRLQLARALMCPSDLLLLDEPTNHLDLDALVWLEAWLQKYPGTMIVISHDREFLDAVTNVTLHIEHAKLTRYGGNYSKFEDMRALHMEQQQAAFGKQQEKIAHLQKFIDRFKAKASKAKQAQSRVKALERMEKVAPLLAEADFTFEFKEPGNIPNPMLSITGASFGYQPEGEPAKIILTNVSRSVQGGQRIGILGANGQGKSTLVKTIAREMGALAGDVTEGKGLNIGYFAQQELDVLRPQDNPLEHMVRLAREVTSAGNAPKEGTGEQALRGFLGSFNFSGDMVRQAVGTMSGGEKARLVLAMMVWQRPNLLLLDEPTNHLDLATREALAVALNEFEGTLMLVSHDRALLRSVCDEFWMVGRGAVTDFDGDLDDYQRYLLDEAKRMREEAKVAMKEAANASSALIDASPSSSTTLTATNGKGRRQQDVHGSKQRSEQMKPIHREIAMIDEQLAATGGEKANLETRLRASALSPAAIAEAGKRLKSVNEQIAQLEERWLMLSGELEALAGS